MNCRCGSLPEPVASQEIGPRDATRGAASRAGCNARRRRAVDGCPPGPPRHADPPPPLATTRRALTALLPTAAAGNLGLRAGAARALPLAPLGGFRQTGAKLRLPIEEVKETLRRDLAEGQYFVTGQLTPEVFDDSCRFKDPTNDIRGLSRYMRALTLLFDPARSEVELLSIAVTGPNTIEASWILGGYLRFPWNPRVEPFKGHTTWTLSPKTGLIVEQEQEWSKSALEALRESFTPSLGPRA